MITSSGMRVGVAIAAGAGVIVAVSLHAQPAASPWAKAPALPTACYQSQEQDDFYKRAEAALTAVQADHYKQNEINARIRESAQSVDPMEMARRMQDAMMKDPQNAMKYMQGVQNLSQSAQAGQQAMLEKEKQLAAEEKALIERYRTALAKSYAPGNARWDALKKKLGIPQDSRGPGEMGVPDWAWKEWEVIQREWDRAYQAHCAQWWNTAGPMHAHMKHYRDFLIQERIPHHQKFVDEPTLANYQMMNVPFKGYGSVAEFVAVEDYIKRAGRIFSQRADRPRCTAKRCDG
jgi:TolA-binding protein